MGRADKNPADFWYQGEIGFFDFVSCVYRWLVTSFELTLATDSLNLFNDWLCQQYIIPLAKKLKDCGVFGVSSDEYLNCKCR